LLMTNGYDAQTKAYCIKCNHNPKKSLKTPNG